MIGWADDFKYSAWVTHVKPVLDYIVRIAELMALAAVFRVGADQVHSLFLEAMATILIYIIGAYSGLPIGLLYYKMRGFTTKSLMAAIAIALPISITVAMLTFFGGIEVSHSVKALGQVSANDR